MAKRLSAKRREQMVARIMAYDITAILDGAAKGDLDFLISFLMGECEQYGNMSDEQVSAEWEQGEYAGKLKRKIVTTSPTYERLPYVRQLWDKGILSTDDSE